MVSDSTHNYSIFKRISTLILVIMCVAISVNVYLMHIKNASQWYAVESEQLGRSLTQQAAKLVAAPLAKNDSDLLAQYIDVVNQGMFVQNAVLYNELGVRYEQAQAPLSIVDMLKSSDLEPLVFVEDIMFENKTIGYIKLVLDKQAVTHHHRSFNRNQLSQTALLIVLSIIVAALAMRLFYKAREKYRLVDDEESLS